MNATIYWTTQRVQRKAQEFRWAAQLWWLNQQVEFVGWRYRLEAILPSTMPPAFIRRSNRTRRVHAHAVVG
jgi:hypothetical protein